jgi:hypothetical protein
MRLSKMTGKYRGEGYTHYIIDDKSVSEKEFERYMWEVHYAQLDLFEEVELANQHRR